MWSAAKSITALVMSDTRDPRALMHGWGGRTLASASNFTSFLTYCEWHMHTH